MVDVQTLSALRTRLQQATGPDRTLDRDLHQVFGGTAADHAPRYTGSSDAIDTLLPEILPDFFETSGLCHLTGHASLGPDYNGPNGDRLRQDWPEEQFHDGFDADLAPGDGVHRKCLARLDCILQALAAQIDPETDAADRKARRESAAGWIGRTLRAGVLPTADVLARMSRDELASAKNSITAQLAASDGSHQLD